VCLELFERGFKEHFTELSEDIAVRVGQLMLEMAWKSNAGNDQRMRIEASVTLILKTTGQALPPMPIKDDVVTLLGNVRLAKLSCCSCTLTNNLSGSTLVWKQLPPLARRVQNRDGFGQTDQPLYKLDGEGHAGTIASNMLASFVDRWCAAALPGDRCLEESLGRRQGQVHPSHHRVQHHIIP
jgi:hypothetical protein